MRKIPTSSKIIVACIILLQWDRRSEGMGWDDGLDGMGWDGVGWDGVDGMGWGRMGWDGMG